MPEFFVATPAQSGLRLDHFLVRKFPDFSRAALARLIGAGAILVNDVPVVKAGFRLHEQDRIAVIFPEQEPPGLVAEPIDFTILHEDEDLLIIDKPAGLVVHPGDGNRQGTVVNGLLQRYPSLPGNDPQRPGIVHRLDKDTSGVMVIAKSEIALKNLGESFKNRRVSKTYHAVLVRHPGQEAGRLAKPIGRHPVNRKKMTIRENDGRYAATKWQVVQHWPGFCFIEIDLETGRTHQIRVHMASLGCPVAGDQLYGGKVDASFHLPIYRQLLHASRLRFRHPRTKSTVECTAPLPDDMRKVISLLNERTAGI